MELIERDIPEMFIEKVSKNRKWVICRNFILFVGVGDCGLSALINDHYHRYHVSYITKKIPTIYNVCYVYIVIMDGARGRGTQFRVF
jgi:hypothetical protein